MYQFNMMDSINMISRFNYRLEIISKGFGIILKIKIIKYTQQQQQQLDKHQAIQILFHYLKLKVIFLFHPQWTFQLVKIVKRLQAVIVILFIQFQLLELLQSSFND